MTSIKNIFYIFLLQVNGIVERIQQNIQDYAKVMDMEIRLKAREREQQLQLQQPQAQTMAVGTSTSTSDCDQKKKEPDILWSNLVKVKVAYFRDMGFANGVIL
jgi:hypothetical protein